MQVFKTYFKILKKQMISIIIYAVLFLFITVMVTSDIKVENEKFKPSKVDAMVINEDGQSDLVDGFMNYIKKYAVLIEPKDNEEDRKNDLFFRRVVYILTIPAGFSEDFQKDGTIRLIKQTVPDSVEATSFDNAVNNYFNSAKFYLKNIPDLDYAKLNTYIENNLKEETEIEFDIVTKDEDAFSKGFNKNFFNFLGYIILSAFITGISIVMFSFHGIDIRRRHSASPLTTRKMNLQLICANLIFVLAYLSMFIIAGYVLNRNRMINANTLLTWLNVLVFSITALSISYLVGITVKSRKAINAISTALTLGLSFLSGIFVQQEYLGAAVLRVASFTPTYWYVKANNTLETITVYKWDQLADVFGYMAIQIGFSAAIISIALVVSKRKRQQAF